MYSSKIRKALKALGTEIIYFEIQFLCFPETIQKVKASLSMKFNKESEIEKILA